MPVSKEKRLGRLALAALVVSAMVGGGVFSLPQNMAQDAALPAVIWGWVITGLGVFFIANTFRILSGACPGATAGIYSYAELGFGKFAGFQMAWAYWLCNIFGNVGYAVLLMDALNYFFPGVFAGGNNLYSVLGGSLIIWVMCILVSRGVKQASGINTIGMICKLVPLALFILVMLLAAHWSKFTDAISQSYGVGTKLGSMSSQIESTMLVTLWAFIGIEGAVVVSARARSQKDVGAATVIGFLGCLFIYVMLSVLPFGRLSQTQLAALANPSTAPVLSGVVGHWGGVVMNLGVIVALLTSWLAFTIMIIEIPYAAAKDGTFPKIFARESANGTPIVSLIVSSLLMQLAMVMVYFTHNAWNTMLSITAVMILPPYLASTGYLSKLSCMRVYPDSAPVKRNFALFCGIAGSIYALWMIYAAGLKYLSMAFWFLALGIPFYMWARHDSGELKNKKTPMFSKTELVFVFIILAVALGTLLWRADQGCPMERVYHKWHLDWHHIW